jgi:hypothetical protein
MFNLARHALVLGYNQRVKRGIPVTGNIQRDFAEVCFQGFAALPVPSVPGVFAGRIALGIPKMFSHLCLQHGLNALFVKLMEVIIVLLHRLDLTERFLRDLEKFIVFHLSVN